MDLDPGSDDYAAALTRLRDKERRLGTQGLDPHERAFIRRERGEKSMDEEKSMDDLRTAIHALELKLLSGSGSTALLQGRFAGAREALDATPARRRNKGMRTRVGKAERYLAKRAKRMAPKATKGRKGKAASQPKAEPAQRLFDTVAPRTYRRADTFRKFMDQF